MLSRTVASKLFRSAVSKPLAAPRAAHMSAVTYNETGHPFQVLSIDDSDKSAAAGSVGANEVKLKFLASPINPADLNMISGGYGISPSFPAVGGNEGVAKVTAVGSNVKNVAVDDHVIPTNAGFGTWRNEAVASETDVMKISKDIPIEVAATLAVNPCTAYRMLSDFVELKEGDWIIQNGANSSVGQAVIQLAKLRGIKTINLVRESADYDDVHDHLMSLGADIVCFPEYLASADYRKLVSDLPAPKLALNCVGGSVTTDLARALGEGATMVTYGGMSKGPVSVPTSALIFKDITLRGFWMSEWVKKHSVEERVQMLDTIAQLAKEDKLRMWIETHKFSEFERALATVVNRSTRRKVVMMMEE